MGIISRRRNFVYSVEGPSKVFGPIQFGSSLVILATVLAAGSAPALAQTTLPSREELRPAERTPSLQRQQGTGLVGRLDSGPCTFEASPLRFKLSGVEFAGLSAVPAGALEGAWTAQRGQEIPVSEICRIRDRATELLLDRGILARVEIPPQQISGGQVRLQVTEAYIAEVTVRGSAGPARRQIERTIGRLKGLAPFDMDVVQRQLLLASDVPGVRISTRVRPSDAGPGAVALEVEVSRDAVDALVAVQNLGTAEAGPWHLIGRVDLNSFTSLGERTSLVVSTTSDFEEQRIVQLLEEVRLGGSGLLARGSLALAETRPGGAVRALDLRGRSLAGAFELAYPLVRHRRHNLWLSGELEVVDQNTEVFGGTARLVDDKLRVLSVRIEGDERARLGAMAGFGSVALTLRKGLDALGASSEGEADLSRAAADPQAVVGRLDARAEIALTPKLSFAGTAALQWTDRPLLAYEEYSVGNFTTGRGYDPGLVSGDRVAASALELRYVLGADKRAAASAFAFFDSARIDNLDPGARPWTVRSVGAGLRVQVARFADLDLAYAHPLDRPFAGARRPGDRLLVNLISRFR